MVVINSRKPTNRRQDTSMHLDSRTVRMRGKNSMDLTCSQELAILLTPVRDLTENWEIDVAKHLGSYLIYLAGLGVGTEEGENVLNFAEAALLIQSCVSIYGKKVDYLWKVMTEVLETCSRQKSRGSTEEPAQKKKSASRAKPSFGDFEAIDPAQQERTQDLDLSANEKKNKKPLKFQTTYLAQLDNDDPSDKRLALYNQRNDLIGNKTDFRLCRKISSLVMLEDELSYYLMYVEPPVEEENVNELNNFINCSGFDDPRNCDLNISLASHPPTPPPSPHPGLDIQNPSTSDGLPNQIIEETAVSCAPGVSRRNENIIAVEKPSREAEENLQDRILRNKQMCRTPEELAASSKKRKLDDDRPGEQVQKAVEIFAEEEIKGTNMKKNGDVVQDNCKEAKPKRKSKKRKENVKIFITDDEIDRIRLELAKDFEGDFLGFEDYELDSDEEEGFRGFGEEDSEPDEEPHDLPDSGCEVDAVNVQLPLPSSQPSDESFRLMVQNKMADSETEKQKFYYQSDLAITVNKWHDYIRPKLLAADKRGHFDIHQYGTEILECFPQSSAKVTIPFHQVVSDKKREDISRYFLSCLMLANTENIEISKSDSRDLAVDCMQLTLLSSVRHHEQLEEYQAPSEEHRRSHHSFSGSQPSYSQDNSSIPSSSNPRKRNRTKMS